MILISNNNKIKYGGILMRKKEKEITDKETIEWIMNEAMVCRIAVSENNIPYIIPMNFGFRDNCLYIHSALQGKKIDIIKKNNNVCFEVDIKTELVTADNPCNWSMKYYSVIGLGKLSFIDDIAEKKNIINIIMEKYSGKSDFKFPDAALNSLAVIKIEISEITGKKSRY